MVLSAQVRYEGLLTLPQWFEVGIEQAALRRADLLAALGELVALENGDFVSKLLNDRLITINLSVLGLDLGH